MNAITPASVAGPDSIFLSLSEISSLTYRAARGAGYEWGEAEEAAFASVWLSRAGLDWAGTILAVLKGARACAPLPSRGRWAAVGQLCPLRTGIAIADFATLQEGPSTHPVECVAVAQPLLVVPFVARAANFLARPIGVFWTDNQVFLQPEQPPLIESSVDTCKPVDVTIACENVRRAMPMWSQFHHAEICNAQYGELNALALRTTVPTSARSQAGAGGEEGDND